MWYVNNMTTEETKPLLLYNRIHPKQSLHNLLILSFFLYNVHPESSSLIPLLLCHVGLPSRVGRKDTIFTPTHGCPSCGVIMRVYDGNTDLRCQMLKSSVFEQNFYICRQGFSLNPKWEMVRWPRLPYIVNTRSKFNVIQNLFIKMLKRSSNSVSLAVIGTKNIPFQNRCNRVSMAHKAEMLSVFIKETFVYAHAIIAVSYAVTSSNFSRVKIHLFAGRQILKHSVHHLLCFKQIHLPRNVKDQFITKGLQYSVQLM